MQAFFDFPEEASREARYDHSIRTMQALLQGENDLIACMANVVAVLKNAFHWHWVGYYRVQDKQLVLGPFQGLPACMRIDYGKGVCGTAWQQRRTIIVRDVSQFPGHIACSPYSRSEIVVPLFREDEIIAVLDIDSEYLHAFDNTDQYFLEYMHHLLFDK